MRPLLKSGYSRARPSATAARSACAASTRDARLHPADDLQLIGAARARRHVGRKRPHRPHRRCGRGSRSPFGMTPTTVHSSPSSLSSLPTIDGSRLKRVSHSPSLITTPRRRCCFVFGRERAAGNRLDAEHVEDARRHPLPRHRLRVAVASGHHHAAHRRRVAGDRRRTSGCATSSPACWAATRSRAAWRSTSPRS